MVTGVGASLPFESKETDLLIAIAAAKQNRQVSTRHLPVLPWVTNSVGD
jgi:hypothetical protein